MTFVFGGQLNHAVCLPFAVQWQTAWQEPSPKQPYFGFFFYYENVCHLPLFIAIIVGAFYINFVPQFQLLRTAMVCNDAMHAITHAKTQCSSPFALPLVAAAVQGSDWRFSRPSSVCSLEKAFRCPNKGADKFNPPKPCIGALRAVLCWFAPNFAFYRSESACHISFWVLS